ncbi:MAG: hypothetical protein ACRDT2_15015 [Natronosporangium sp.]
MALPIPPEAYELSAWARRLGVDDPLPYLRELSLIDTDALRDVGTRVWGLAYRDSRFSENLADRAQRMWDRLLEDVGPTWSSRAAYPAFKDRMETIRDAMDLEEANRLPVVGNVLVDLADAFEVAWLEIVGWVISAAGLVVAAAGLVMAGFAILSGVGAPAGVILAVISMIIAVASLYVTYLSTTRPRLADLAEAGSRVEHLTTETGSASEMVAPDAVAGWDAARSWRPGKEGR